MQSQSNNSEIYRQCDIFIDHSKTFKVISEANLSEHWQKKRKRVKAQHQIVWWELRSIQPILDVKLPCTIIMTRYAGKEMDSDNLVSAFKHVRDAIADYIHPGLPPGKADDDKQITWVCKQLIRSNRIHHGIRIEII